MLIVHVPEYDLVVIFTIDLDRHEVEDVAKDKLERLSIVVTQDCFTGRGLLLEDFCQAAHNGSIVEIVLLRNRA